MRSTWIFNSTALMFVLTVAMWLPADAWATKPMSPRLCPEGVSCSSSAVNLADRDNQYFIDSRSACRSGCDGRSLEKAWSSPRQAEAAGLGRGADVCLMSGSVFEDTAFDIAWSGSDADRAIIGSCYEDAGAVYWWWEGPRARSVAKAEVNGTFDRGCIAAGAEACNPEGSGHVPANGGAGLVQVHGSYVTLRAFKAHDSAARGIMFRGQGQTRNHIIDMSVENLYGSLFFHLGSAPSTRHIVRNNVFENAGYRFSRVWSGYNANVGGSCLQMSRGTHYDKAEPAYDIYEGNVLGNCSGEVGFLDSSHHIIRGNIFYNTRNTGIYLDNVAHSVVEWNITFLARDNCDIYSANGDCGPSSSGGSAQGGARWQIEDYPAGCGSVAKCNQTTTSSDNVVRNNLYVWGEEGWGSSMEKFANESNSVFVGKYFLHNTIYNATIKPWSDGNTPSQQLQDGMETFNNVFTAASMAGGSRCRSSADRPYYGYNVWSESRDQLDDDCEAAGDEFAGSPDFTAPDRSGPPLHTDRPTFADYQIRGGAGKGNAQDLSNEVIPEIDPDCGDFPQLGDLDPSYGPEINWTPTCSNWRKKAYYDFQGRYRGERSDKGL